MLIYARGEFFTVLHSITVVTHTIDWKRGLIEPFCLSPRDSHCQHATSTGNECFISNGSTHSRFWVHLLLSKVTLQTKVGERVEVFGLWPVTTAGNYE